MSKLYLIKTKQPTQFSQTLIPGDTTLFQIFAEVESCDISLLPTLLQYNQVAIEEIEYDEKQFVADGSEVDTDSELISIDDESDDESDDDGEGSEESNVVASEAKGIDSNQSIDDLATIGIDENLIDALKFNGIDSVAKLSAFIAEGKDLVDLEKIGPVRANKILAAFNAVKK